MCKERDSIEDKTQDTRESETKKKKKKPKFQIYQINSY